MNADSIFAKERLQGVEIENRAVRCNTLALVQDADEAESHRSTYTSACHAIRIAMLRVGVIRTRCAGATLHICALS